MSDIYDRFWVVGGLSALKILGNKEDSSIGLSLCQLPPHFEPPKRAYHAQKGASRDGPSNLLPKDLRDVRRQSV